jgi:hypothetical protein
MSDDAADMKPPDDEAIDPGPSVEELAGFEQDASSGFLGLLRRKIHRRTTTAQVASFSWNMPGMIFLELCRILVQLLQVKHSSKGERT